MEKREIEILLIFSNSLCTLFSCVYSICNLFLNKFKSNSTSLFLNKSNTGSRNSIIVAKYQK